MIHALLHGLDLGADVLTCTGAGAGEGGRSRWRGKAGGVGVDESGGRSIRGGGAGCLRNGDGEVAVFLFDAGWPGGVRRREGDVLLELDAGGGVGDGEAEGVAFHAKAEVCGAGDGDDVGGGSLGDLDAAGLDGFLRDGVSRSEGGCGDEEGGCEITKGEVHKFGGLSRFN